MVTRSICLGGCGYEIRQGYEIRNVPDGTAVTSFVVLAFA